MDAAVTTARVECVHPRELGSVELSRWRQLQAGDAYLDSPFLHPTFAQVVAAHRPDTRVGVVHSGSAIAAFFPHQRGRGGLGAPLAAGLSDAQGVICDADTELRLAPILAGCGLRLWSFDHLIAAQRRLLDGSPGQVELQTSPVIDLTAGTAAWESHVKAHGSLLQTTDRKRRKLAREVGDVEVVLASRDHAALERILAWKSAQYRRTGRRDRFAVPAHRRLVHDLLDRQEDDFGGILTLLLAGGQVVAGHFGVRTRTTVAWWFPTYDTALGRYSPGMIVLLELARAAATSDIMTIDLGRGDEPYKETLSNTAIPLLAGHVATSTTASVLYAAPRWPRRAALRFVLERPALRRAARQALNRVGETRESLRPGGSRLRHRHADAGQPGDGGRPGT